MIVVALRTGLRLGELMALQWDDIDLVRGRMLVRRSVTRGVIGTPKSGKSLDLPLGASVVKALQRHRHLRSPWVFGQEDGSMLSKGQTKWPLRRAQRKAGLLEIGWHDLRHTFASHLVMRGVPLKAVQELLGHQSIDITMRYAHLAASTLRDAVDVLEPQQAHSTRTAHEISETRNGQLEQSSCPFSDGGVENRIRPRKRCSAQIGEVGEGVRASVGRGTCGIGAGGGDTTPGRSSPILHHQRGANRYHG